MGRGFYWQLRYFDGTVQNEPDEEGSIRDTRPNPAAIYVMADYEGNGIRVPVVQMPLRDEFRPPGYGPWKPIFYRKRSRSVRVSLERLVQPEDIARFGRLDAVVFGRGRETPNTYDAQLNLVLPSGKLVTPPSWAVDRAAVELAITAR